MKKISFLTLALCFSGLFTSCSTTSGELPPLSSIRPGVAAEGTLANHILTRDASQAIQKLAGGNKKVTKFIIQQPVGIPGKKAWRELWVSDIQGTPKRFIMTFREDGQGSADFEIQKM